MRGCGYGWNPKSSTFCGKCGKALVPPTPPWQSGASAPAGKGGKAERGKSADKGKGWPSADRGKNDAGKGAGKGFLQGERWNRRGKRAADGGSPSPATAASLIDSIIKIPGMETVDLSAARQQAAAIAASAAPPAPKAQPTPQELEALEVLKGSVFFQGEDALVKLVCKAASRQGHAKQPSLGEFATRIEHKEGTLAKAKQYAESCERWVAEAQAGLEKAKADVAERSNELAALVVARDARREQECRSALVTSLCGEGVAAGIFPAIADDAELRKEMEELQGKARELVKRAAAKAAPRQLQEPVPVVAVGNAGVGADDLEMGDDELDDLFNAENLEPVAKRARARALMVKFGERVRQGAGSSGSPAADPARQRERSRSAGRGRTDKPTSDGPAAAAANAVNAVPDCG